MKTIFNPFTKKLQELQNIGGKYGIAGRGHYTRVVIHDDFTLVPSVDPIYQYLDPDDRNTKTAKRFMMINTIIAIASLAIEIIKFFSPTL